MATTLLSTAPATLLSKSACACGARTQVRVEFRAFGRVDARGFRWVERRTFSAADGENYVGQLLPQRDGSILGVCRRCSAPHVLLRVEGRVTDHECGAACRDAKGHVCDCSCGGEFHGADA